MMNGRGRAGGGASVASAAPNASASATTTAAAGGNPADLAGRAPDDNDWSTYFCTYAYLYHQKDMLEDHTRTGAYAAAILGSAKACFEGKTVLDVGAGSGILSIFAARAGAKKVFAVEATPMAAHARTLIKHNGLDGVIEVLQGTVESITLPEKVDVIVSEWMGYLLLRESMLDSVLAARDAWLKPGGSLWPSHARLLLAPARSTLPHARAAELQNAMQGWERFAGEAQEHYGVDVSCLTRAYREEQALYYSKTAAWADVDPGDLVGGGQVVASMDLAEIGLEESKRPLEAQVDLLIEGEGGEGGEDDGALTTCDAIVGYFDVSFRGGKVTKPPASSSSESSTGAPATEPIVTLSTEPCAEGATHWGQQVFPLCPPLPVKRGDRVQGSVVVRRRKDNPRLLEVELDVRVVEGARKGAVAADGALKGVRKERYQVE